MELFDTSKTQVVVGTVIPERPLGSTMHMTWTLAVCGRLENRYQYSILIVYNNFPWPTPSERQRAAKVFAVQAILDAIATYSESTLFDLYNKLTSLLPPDKPKPGRKKRQNPHE